MDHEDFAKHLQDASDELRRVELHTAADIMDEASERITTLREFVRDVADHEHPELAGRAREVLRFEPRR